MTDNPDSRPGDVAVVIPVNDVPHAPFIFYEAAPVSGYTNGVINLTLSATRTYIGPDGPRNEHVVVAYLRGNIQAAVNLRAAIDNVMFHVVETLRGGPVPPDAAIQVDMPICQTAAALKKRLDKRRRKLPEFDAGTELFRRIESLQPYSSLAVATAIPAELGSVG